MSENSRPAPDTYDVVVAGMGPVGQMVSLMLARAGHRVLVADKKAAPYTLPRAVAHDGEIARLLQSAGMPVDSMPEAIEPYDDMYVWVNANDEILHLVDWTGIDQSGWQNTYFYNQPSLEAHIDRHVRASANIDAIRGTAVSLVGQDAEGADVELGDVASSAVRRVRAKYVLGADGANSDMRASGQLGWNDLGYFFDWLVVDVIPGPDLTISHLAKQVADPVRPTTVVPGGPGKRRWEFMLLEGENPEDLTKPEKIWELVAPFGVTPETAEIERGVVYRFDSGWATNWRNGRVMVLGDAAHKMPPFAGQGLAAGFRDCLNLSWKLDLVLRGLAGDAILDSYGDERSPHVSDFIDFSMSLGKIICITDPAAAAERDSAMLADRASGRAAEAPPAPRLGPGLHTGDSGGYLSWQGEVSVAGTPGKVKFDDAFGAGALILARPELASELTDATRAALNAVGIRVTGFDMSDGTPGVDAFDDVNGTYAGWFAQLGAGAVLVRPDFYVYGSADSASGVRALAESFLAALKA